MPNMKNAVQKAKDAALNRNPSETFFQEVYAALDEILAAREMGVSLTAIAAEAGVSVKRLSEAVNRAQRRRAGLTNRGSARKNAVGPRTLLSPRASELSAQSLLSDPQSLPEVTRPSNPLSLLPSSLSALTPAIGKRFISPKSRDRLVSRANNAGVGQGAVEQAKAEQAAIEGGRQKQHRDRRNE